MKIDRLIGILSVLLQKDRTTAPELAEKFEVSRRTISRDLETLCRAGIPIVTVQGQNGGISIMEGYRLDRTLLTAADLQAILAGLGSLDSVSRTGQVAQLMEKLSPGSSVLMPGGQNILIDLSAWYKESLAPKIELVRRAMDSRLLLSFRYLSPKGETCRTIEPYYLIFRWSSWYVWGYCLSREDCRLFKLNRMDGLTAGDGFTPRPVPQPDLENDRVFPGNVPMKALFEPDCRWRLAEEYGRDSFEELENGKLLFQASFNNEEELLAWLMSFREKAVLLEPEALRKELGASLLRAARRYEEE